MPTRKGARSPRALPDRMLTRLANSRQGDEQANTDKKQRARGEGLGLSGMHREDAQDDGTTYHQSAHCHNPRQAFCRVVWAHRVVCPSNGGEMT